MGEESDSDAVEEVRSGLIVEGAVEHDMGGVIEHLVAVAAAGRPDAVAILVVSLPPVQVRIAEAGMCGWCFRRRLRGARGAAARVVRSSRIDTHASDLRWSQVQS